MRFMSHAAIRSLRLKNFRNFDEAQCHTLHDTFVILIGENGAGKTNTLEAISLLSPGRGLRNASVPDYQSQALNEPWVVATQYRDHDGDMLNLGIGRDPQKPDKKIMRANGETLKSQERLGEICRMIWLTPQMDGLFLQASSERRRFFDRLVATFDGGHTGRMIRYEKAMRQRLAILRDALDKGQKPDQLWLSPLETMMAETGVAIAAARVEMITNLTQSIHVMDMQGFPNSEIYCIGDAEQALDSQPALQVEDMIKARLEGSRISDAQTGRTAFGIHKTDMAVIYKDKNMKAAQCSTGEQKALLTAIILAHGTMVAGRYGSPPILLFDEVTAHFDDKRRDALFEILANLKTQIWLSGQDEAAFKGIKSKKMINITRNTFTSLHV
jgi:DNA replication and repair protein RecF